MGPKKRRTREDQKGKRDLVRDSYNTGGVNL